ncbi:MAG: radical SAM protein [Bacillota bacterium]|nr:radical SAM protein [Bacillota bacterium]
MKKIVLIEPKSSEDHVYKHVRMPRLGLPILGTQLKDAGYEVRFFLGTGNSLPWPEIIEADLVGISTTTATCREAYQVAGLLRSHRIPVVIGGIHASFMPDEAMQFADYLVRGEAELSFLPLVQSIEAGLPPHNIPGVSYWSNGEMVHNETLESKIDIDTLPIPDLTLLDRYSSMSNIPVMTSRGCPFNCTFCCVTEMFGRRYRHRCTESVLEELTRYQGKNIFFCDDNFTASPKLTKELLRGIIDRGIKLKRWGAQVRVDAANDDELLDLMYRSGCGIVYIGFESINPATLERYNKQQTVEDIEEAIKRFHHYKIRIHGMFVFGADTDTVDTIRQTADFALRAKIDSVQFMTLTPFPGTPFYEQMESEKRILTRDWSLYDGHHTVFQPELMSAEELQSETVIALKRFYSLQNILKNLALTGWGSVIHRTIGWGLTRHFERRNRWFEQLLKHQQYFNPQPVSLFDSLLTAPVREKSQAEFAISNLKVSLTEQSGVLYLKLRGFAGSLHRKELHRVLKGFLRRHYSQMVINTEGLRFISHKAAAAFGAYFDKLGCRMHRLQIITTADSETHSMLNWKSGNRFKMPCFELLLKRR